MFIYPPLSFLNLLLLQSKHIIFIMLYQANALKSFPKIIAIGKNYMKHVKEMGGSEAPKSPVVFTKPWSSISYMPKQIQLPSAKEHRIDHEL